MVYDVIIVGWGASGLFCSLFLPKQRKKCIIEKTDKLWSKVLLSGWERCNLTNIHLDPNIHYVWTHLKSLPSLFHRFGPEDMIQYLNDHAIATKIEDNGRVLLTSGKAKQLVEFLVHESAQNDTQHLLNHEVVSVECADPNIFVVTTSLGSYSAKKVIVATWWMTYPQIGASPFAYELAENLWLSLSSPRPALCGIQTKEDVAPLAWNTVQATLLLFVDNKMVYSAKWPVLFTHQWVSWPVVFDATLYIDDLKKCTFQLDFDLAWTSKKVVEYFKLLEGDTLRDFALSSLKSIQEAKVSVWWICLQDLDQSFQSKKFPWLYFIGESLDITGKTWWYNLQRAWTSGYVCAKNLVKSE